MGIDLKEANILIAGATGPAVFAPVSWQGSVANDSAGQNKEKLEDLAERIRRKRPECCGGPTNVRESVSQADVVITVTGSAESVIDVSGFKPGAVVCMLKGPGMYQNARLPSAMMCWLKEAL